MSLDLNLFALSSSFFFFFCILGRITSELMCFSVHHIRRYKVSACSIMGDVNFDHLVKMVSARFLYPNNVNISFFRVNK